MYLNRRTPPPAEIALLLATVRGEGIRECIDSVFDWQKFYDLAAWHGLLPLVASSLKETCSDLVPPSILSDFQNVFRRSAARNLFYTSELSRIMGWFRNAGIPIIPLKGPALAFSIYANFAQREFEDLDFLTPRAHAQSALDLMTSHGFIPAVDLRESALDSFVKTNYELHFDRNESPPVAVELHWGLQEQKFFSSTFDPESWWERLESVTIGGVGVMAPSRVDMLLFLCAHGAKHCWERLKWVCDVARLINCTPDLDWQDVHRRAQQMRIERVFLLGIQLASDLIGCCVPETLLQAATANHSVSALTADVRRQLFRGLPSSNGARGKNKAEAVSIGGPPNLTLLRNARFQLRLHERVLEKVRYIVANLFVPTAGEWQIIALPGALTPLYYLLRPIRLLENLILGHSTLR